MDKYFLELYTASVKNLNGVRWGFINDKGRFIIKPQYERAYDFQENGLAIVKLKKGYGIINSFGKYVVMPKYDTIEQFSEGRAVVIDQGGFKVIDESGKEITVKPYSFIGSYQDERAMFSGTDADGNYLYGYLDKNGKEIIPLKYESAGDFSNGKAVVKIQDNKYALIGLKGELLNTYNYANVGNLSEGLLSFQETSNSKFGYIDQAGSVIIKPQFTGALPFRNRVAVVNTAEDFKNNYGVIDKAGNFIIKPQYNNINTLGENRLAVGKALNGEMPYIGSKYAIADTSGKLLTDFIYFGVSNYSNNLASAYDNKDTFFIDKAGNKLLTLPVVSGSGTLSFRENLIKAFVDNRTSYYNKSGKLIWRQNKVIPLNYEYRVIEEKYRPNKDYLVYYPEIAGMKSKLNENKVNTKLKELSQIKHIDPNIQLDYSFTGDFLIEFFNKNLLVIELYSYNFTFGAAHGMPSEIYPHIDLVAGRFYELKDLFKTGSDYVKVLSNIIALQIKKDPQYSYVFPDAYKGIKEDQPFYIGKEDLYIYFFPYDIAPYAAGFPTFKIPYNEIMNIINVNGEFWRSFN